MKYNIKNNIQIPGYIRNLKPYEITPQEPWVFSKKNNIFKADWNEGCFLPIRIKLKIIANSFKSYFFNWYPDSTSFLLNKAISNFLKLSENNILTFAGSDDALDKICRLILQKNDRVLVITPTYDNFEVYAKSCGAKIISYELYDIKLLNINNLISICKKNKIKCLYITSPNNPLGYSFPIKKIEEILKKLSNIFVVCDQAYVEYRPISDCKFLTKSFKNLIITRSFSKAFSLAGSRIGYVIADNVILKQLAKLRNGKNINMIGQLACVDILKNVNLYLKWIEFINREKKFLYKKFSELKIKYYQSDANFILFYVKFPKKLLFELKKELIFARDKIKSTNGGIRISIGEKSKNLRFLKVLKMYKFNYENKLK